MFRERPTYPPSKLALVKKEITKDGLSDDIKELLKNTEWIKTSWIFTVILGTWISLGNLLTPLLGDLYTPSEISSIGGVFVLFGIVGTVLAGLIIDKTHAYIKMIRIICSMCSVMVLLLIWIIPTGSLGMTMVSVAILGTFISPILPAGYSFSALITSPIGPAVANGFMMTFAQMYATLWTVVDAWLLTYNLKLGIAAIMIATITTLLTSLTLKLPRNRNSLVGSTL